MKFEFIANASFLITLANGSRMLTDPWFVDGIYYGTWFNFPPLTDEAQQRYLSLSPDCIFISHLHPDHLDVATLKHFDRSTPILIGKLPHDHLRRKLAGLGFTDIRELSLGEPAQFDGAQITIFDAFASSSENIGDEVGYAIDTSMWITDSDGTTLFNNVDNTIQAQDAERIRREFGVPDLAILPYCGGSLYPHGFLEYSEDEKILRKSDLCERMLKRFTGLVKAMGSPPVVPAAGSYALGSGVAAHTRFLHQATPAEIRAQWLDDGLPEERLIAMCTGDVLDVKSLEIRRDPSAPYRGFTSEERAAYAMSTADRPLGLEQVVVPPEFEIPWPRLMKKARHNQFLMQQRLNVFPDYDVIIKVTTDWMSDNGSAATSYLLPLESDDIRVIHGYEPAERNHIVFRVDPRLMLMILIGAAIWNNAEIAGCLSVERRRPDSYSPTVHSLMSFFAL